jgi:hypothetical protein
MDILNKVKLWLFATGFTSIGWLLGAIGGYVIGMKCLAVGALAVFLYINFNVLYKLYKGITNK